MQLKKGQFYHEVGNLQSTVCYLGKAQHMDTGNDMAILRSFKDPKTFVMDKTDFECRIDNGDFVYVPMERDG
ncbi:hypothetical protein [Natribacillus halophilus]|uniref:Uncharacterized protein n=1 Tax=Natribacillus halophilus TaxID=549003 RepID=A0A1G8RTR1_9BACI|nr:hypothetical protein [Natribacillus halophilus]SDJ20381.1 hypothetical protein SAMN04488123_12043 [Natribacillus halophilus]